MSAPLLALGSSGGSTIITTVLQILLNRVDLGMDRPAAPTAPRATQRSTAQTFAEQGFLDRYGTALTARGHRLILFPGPPAGQTGAATALEYFGSRLVQAGPGPVRRPATAARRW